MRKTTISILIILLPTFLMNCNSKQQLFQRLKSSSTGIKFSNNLVEDSKNNVLNYEYFYNGGGVGAADFNNDGLVDLFFSGNMTENKLYINEGNLKFKDITKEAGIEWQNEWSTGVSVIDINNDGWQDIYVSVSSSIENPNLRRNKLYINQKDKNIRFKESAKEYQLDLKNYTTQTAFFDFDKDGDLDAYVLNHNVYDFKRFDVELVRKMRDSLAGDLFLENRDGKFFDISEKAGIKGSPIGFGLGVNICDINQDGWEDIYVSNDYLEEDFLYINNKNGTFSDKIKAATNHVSYFSMGSDIMDINNDLLPDIFTVDMMPEDNKRQKLLFGPDRYDAYLNMLQNDVHSSFMRNMLQLNNGDSTFSEIGQLAGISNTDWSWSPLIADFDNDGYKDIFVSNGYLRDYTNMDFLKFYSNEGKKDGVDLFEVVKKMPSTKTSNYIFKNNKNLTFSNNQKEWGFSDPIISNGATYADLDNDGDLEIITNNLNEEAAVYKNLSVEKKIGNFLNLKLKASQQECLGAKVVLYSDGIPQFQEYNPIHGFQSSTFSPLHFGLGSSNKIDSLLIFWNNGKAQKLTDIKPNQTLEVPFKPENHLFKLAINDKFLNEVNSVDFVHSQLPLNDFNHQVLLPQMYSYIGPRIAKGDVNGDGKEDIYVGGGKGETGAIYIQIENNNFRKTEQASFKGTELCTDSDAFFFDIDQDGDLDLFVVSGGYQYLPNDLLLRNRIYINDGKGNFSQSPNLSENNSYSDNVAKPVDFDKDGDMDIFIGAGCVPLNYPICNPSRLLRNDKGQFVPIDFPELNEIGIINDALVIDYNKDGWDDIILVGEWTGIIQLKNENGKFILDKTNLSKLTGWWQRIIADDFDKDGDLDLVVGNFGLNTQFKPSEKEPLNLLYDDFDQNGKIDPIFSYYIQGKLYPAYSRDEIQEQLAGLKKRYTTYQSYSEATSEQVFTELKSEKTKIYTAENLATCYFENVNGNFERKELPIQAQFSPVMAISAVDLNNDGYKDLVLGGNQSHSRARFGTYDASYGQQFLNDKKGSFIYFGSLGIRGNMKDIVNVGDQLIFGINNQKVRTFKIPFKTDIST